MVEDTTLNARANKTVNGIVIMRCLANLKLQPTLLNIARFIANEYNEDIGVIKLEVKAFLDQALSMGLFVRERGKYYFYSASSDEDDDAQSDQDSDEGDDSNEEKSRRRRRRNSSKKQKSKSRSRSPRRRKSK